MLPDDQVHPDTHALTMVNNVIGVVNYVIAARPSLRNFMIADTGTEIAHLRYPDHGNLAVMQSRSGVWPPSRLTGHTSNSRPCQG